MTLEYNWVLTQLSWLLWFTLVCAAVPPIDRPSDTQFINYAQQGKMNLVAQALSSFPDLINVKDTVSDLWYPITSTVWSAMWTTNVLKLYVVNLWHNSPMPSLQFSMSYTWPYCQFTMLTSLNIYFVRRWYDLIAWAPTHRMTRVINILEKCERNLTAFYCFIWARHWGRYQTWVDKRGSSTR